MQLNVNIVGVVEKLDYIKPIVCNMLHKCMYYIYVEYVHVM